MCTVICVSLLLLLAGTVICKPIQVRSLYDVDAIQPTRCGMSKPRTASSSTCEATKERRYFFHDTNSKGCKPFGLCHTDSSRLDAKLNEGTENYFLDFDSCQKVCMTYVQCPSLSLEDNVRVSSTNGLSGWGQKIVYECNEGYSFPQNQIRYSRVCQKNGTWSGSEPRCLKQCKSPPAISNGNFAPAKDLYSYGGLVHYSCNVGFILVEESERACGDEGQWMGPEPNCTCALPLVDGKCPSLCPEPSLIENGDINAPEGARIHGGTSFYSCREGFILIGNSSRTCYNGSWLGKDPVCWKVMLSVTIRNSTQDVTNSSVTLAKGSNGIVVDVIPTPKNVFNDSQIRWDFMGKNDRRSLPAGLMVEKLKLTFNTILNTEEQEGNYTITFGKFSASFMVDIDGNTDNTKIPHFVTFNPEINKLVDLGYDWLIHCVSAGKPAPAISWSHNNKSINTSDPKYSIMQSTNSDVTFSGLTIHRIAESDLGEYHCIAANSAGRNSTLVVRLQAKGKRSVEESSRTNSLCHQTSTKTATFVGRVTKMPQSGQVPTYRVHIKQVLRSLLPATSHELRKKKMPLSVVAWPSSVQDIGGESINTNSDYVFQGQLIKGQIFLASSNNIHRYTPEIQQQLADC